MATRAPEEEQTLPAQEELRNNFNLVMRRGISLSARVRKGGERNAMSPVRLKERMSLAVRQR